MSNLRRPFQNLITSVALLIVLATLSLCSIEQWTIGIPGGTEEANRVADQHGCKNLGLVPGFDDVYLFEKRISPNDDEITISNQDEFNDLVHRTKRELEAHSSVKWADPQIPQTRVKRGLINSRQLAEDAAAAFRAIGRTYNNRSAMPQLLVDAINGGPLVNAPSPVINEDKPFNDELWKHQWYLQDTSNAAHLQNGIDIKVEDVWKMGFTGQGVVVSILDDGLEWNHTDIIQNYDPRASYDMNNNRSDPFPRYDHLDSNSHGTRCAGEVAMVANNKKCGVGVAPRARIGGIKCLDGQVVDRIEYMSLIHNIDYIDIYSGSWGPQDNGHTVEGPKRLASQALERGVTHGRGGKGALYVWANGNGGPYGDNCNCDGYVSSIYTISIGGVTQQGQIPFYGERCASTLAVTTSSGAYTDRKIVTTDLHNKCTIDYTGTSAAAPLAAGVYALVLEANKNLTWRDVQHLTVWTSDPLPMRDNPGWKRNAAGLIFNSRFGFGLINAKTMVQAAIGWPQVTSKSICSIAAATRLPAFIQSRNMAYVTFVSDGCQHKFMHPSASRGLMGNRYQSPQMMNSPHAQMNSPQQNPVVFLEHVQVIVDIEYTSRGSLDIFLISPAGTVSTLLTRRPLDVTRDGFDKWPLMSVHFWGETSFGKWSLIVRDKDGQNNRGLLRNATLVLHGTTTRPLHMNQRRVYEGGDQVASFMDPVLELDEDDIYDLNTFPNEMSLVRDDSYTPTFIKSVIAAEKANQRE